MAKKKSSANSDLVNQVNDKFGTNVIVGSNYLMDSRKTVVPASPMIDGMLNGGIPFGSFCIFTGPPKVGKTSLALNLAGNGLSIPTEFEKPRKLFIMNIEHRLNIRDLQGVSTLRPFIEGDRIQIVQSERGNILRAEDFLDIGEQLIHDEPGSIFLFDSFSQLCSKEGFSKEWDGKQYRDDVPKLLSLFVKRIAGVIPIQKSIIIGITHKIANTGFGFSSWAEASGNKIQYAVDVKMEATNSSPWKDGDSIIGQEVHWKCLCSPLQNGPVELQCTSKLRYGHGIDSESELINVAVDLGLIKKGGAWYTIPEDLDESIEGGKFQGLEKCRQALIENRQIYDVLNRKYREMMDLPV